MMKLSAMETKCLTAFRGADYEFGFMAFDGISKLSGIDRNKVRRFVRALARKGALEYQRGLWTEDGTPAGSGYGITDAGREFLKSHLSNTED